jgi:hypothetical protein
MKLSDKEVLNLWIEYLGEIVISYCPSRAVMCKSGSVEGLSVEIVVRYGSL